MSATARADFLACVGEWLVEAASQAPVIDHTPHPPGRRLAVVTMPKPTYPEVDESRNRLHRAGWSIGEAVGSAV